MDEKDKYSGLAVLVIDMQPLYLSKLDTNTRLALDKNQLEVVSYYARRNVPVFGVEMDEQRRTIPMLRRYFSRLPIRKEYRDGFHFTNLKEKLKREQCTDIVMMGLFRSECVAATMEGARLGGFQIYTANSLIADNPSNVERVTDDELRSLCSLSADTKELFSAVEMRKKVKE